VWCGVVWCAYAGGGAGSSYSALVQELLSLPQHAPHHGRLVHGFQLLLSGNGMAAKWDRLNRQRFRKNVREFVQSCAGLFRTK